MVAVVTHGCDGRLMWSTLHYEKSKEVVTIVKTENGYCIDEGIIPMYTLEVLYGGPITWNVRVPEEAWDTWQ